MRAQAALMPKNIALPRLRSIHKLMLMLDSEIRWLQDLELYSV